MTILCIPTLNRKDLLEKCVRSAFAGVYSPSYVVILDNGQQNIPAMEFTREFPNIIIVEFGHNLGVPASWNFFLEYTGTFLGTDTGRIVIANDDIVFSSHTLWYLMAQRPHNALVTGRVVEKCGFSLFAINPYVVSKVGWFDEDFTPAYFEDNDYAYRCKLAGIPIVEETRAAYEHARSSTIAAFTKQQQADHVASFVANEKLYVEKWGGMPGEEKYEHPFNRPSASDSLHRVYFSTMVGRIVRCGLPENMPMEPTKEIYDAIAR